MKYEQKPSEAQRAIIEEPEISVPLKVVAGAGTGKTFVLAHRFVWLVLHRGLAPERLLALTFTKNAAAEMRLRIRRLLRLNGCPQPAVLWVHTFHSFADRLLREKAYAAGLNPEPRVLSATQEMLYFNELLDAVFAGEFTTLKPLAPENLAGRGIEKPEDLRRLLRGMLSQAKGRGLTPDAFRKDALACSARFWSTLPAALQAQARPATELPETLRQVFSAAYDLDLRPPAEGKWKSGDTIDVRKLYFRKGKREIDTPRPDTQVLFSEARAIEESLIESATALYELYLQRLEAEGAIDYDGQILQALEVLHDERLGLAEHYRQSFDYLLIDEFQDTCPSQLRLIELIARPWRVTVASPQGTSEKDLFSHLLVVGDGKQSIYSWRNAEPKNMKKLLPVSAGETVEGREVLRPLTESYRLNREIAELANRVGQAVNPQDPALVPCNHDPGRILFPTAFQDQGGTRRSRRQEAAYLANEICHLQEAGEIEDLAHVAILMRQRRSFRPLKVALERRGLRYQAQGGVGFFEHPLARDVLAWLRLLHDPQQDMYAARLLMRPPSNLADRELFLLLTVPEGRGTRDRPRDTSVMELLEQRAADPELSPDLRQRLREFQATYAELSDLAQQTPARQTLEALWRQCLRHVALTPSEEAAVPVVRGTFEGVIAELSENRPPSLHDLVRTLELYLGDDQQPLPVANQPARGAVQVLTIHGAKGLDYPVVFLLGWTPRAQSGLRYDERWGVRGLPLHGEDPKGTVLKLLSTLGASLEDDEELRLAYVGLTRAKRILGMTRAADKDGKLPKYPPAEFLAVLQEEPAPALPEIEAEETLLRPAAPAVLQQRRLRPPEHLRVSFTQLRRLEDCPRAWVLSREATGWPEAGEDAGETEGSLVGSRFHQYAAAVNRGGLPPPGLVADLKPEEARRLQALSEAFLRSEWAQPGEAAEVERPLRLLRRVDGCLVEITGVADLLLPGSGRLVDYKTEAHLSPENRAKHALQMYLYREALREEGGCIPAEAVIAHVRPEGLESVVLSTDELEAQPPRLEGLLRRLVDLAGGAGAESHPGPHCQYCEFAECCQEGGNLCS